ncbi:hypothetical protein F4810DRAFT_653870 [Camillea tinctor]|nr:hypothetical protein F4810DRAFT_653870 [Camillea tinctor]
MADSPLPSPASATLVSSTPPLSDQEESWEEIYEFVLRNRRRVCRKDPDIECISDSLPDSCSDAASASTSASAAAPMPALDLDLDLDTDNKSIQLDVDNELVHSDADFSDEDCSDADIESAHSGKDSKSVHSNTDNKLIRLEEDTESKHSDTDNKSIHSGADDESVYSETSTLVYGQEPFSTFQNRVVELACNTIWPGVSPRDITVERLVGGSYNRITGISRRVDDELDMQFQYILRVHRSEFSQRPIDCEIASLLFVHHHTQIPLPLVLGFDITDNNAIGSAYMVQNRVQGINLTHTYLSLSHENKCKLARELGNVYNQILDVQSSTYGMLVPSPGDKDISSPICVAPIPIQGDFDPPELPDPALVKPYTNSAPVQSTLEILTSLLRARQEYRIKKCRDHITYTFTEQFYIMAAELEADGWFSDVPISLAHLDLGPHNILINIDLHTNEDAHIISSILDWDSALLLPMFAACTPPMWLWGWKEGEEEDERNANDIPPTPEAREIKQLFEEAAGPEYMRFAYRPEYRFARRLLTFALDGMSSTDGILEAGKMLKEWRKLRQPHPES